MTKIIVSFGNYSKEYEYQTNSVYTALFNLYFSLKKDQINKITSINIVK